MRALDEHKINPGNDKLSITVLDKQGHGGATHLYQITGYSRRLICQPG